MLRISVLLLVVVLSVEITFSKHIPEHKHSEDSTLPRSMQILLNKMEEVLRRSDTFCPIGSFYETEKKKCKPVKKRKHKRSEDSTLPRSMQILLNKMEEVLRRQNTFCPIGSFFDPEKKKCKPVKKRNGCCNDGVPG